ncbi:phospho-N-acetylmuramoyl-pentapeptide-transferase [Butyrivibrio sp. XB500-5]|uniref:phospho-N-acetylmuramoyl-pentapeptide- transferase n=1 Tax=Butyrivibrio sp. XB500-5 TaxID=2364880 RepID=UPI000EA9D5A1|nr:phospho-N-acetylmuramoyl-pentapeptide-transferase [Butyrivibrio sp. XB500-5]RKM62994.1 phospho-N-acetylmuramoyl-pentapeptide-transferase [Butyrivibrio sp. XB500-5]
MSSYVLRTFIPVVVSFMIAVITGPAIINELRKLKAGQTERKEGLASHQKKTGTPTMGGIIFLLPLLVVGLFYAPTHKEVIPVLILTFGFGFLGFLDDFIKVVKKDNLGLRAWQKFLGQFVVSMAFAFYIESCTDLSLAMRVPFTDIMLDFGFWNIPIMFFIAIGTANGTNFTDGVDGLCASVTAVIAGFFGVAAIAYGSDGAQVVSCVMLGALLGYLVYNVYPGKVMMGDTGSLAIGGFVTGIAYVLQMPIFIAIVGFIYMFEVISVMLQVSYFKLTNGKRIFRMAPIHHHFEKGGWSETKVVNVFTTVTILLCLLAYIGL